MCILAAIPLATAAAAQQEESSCHEFPLQKLTIEDFTAEGFILDIGGGGEGVIGQMKSNQVVAIDLSKEELANAPAGPLKIVMDATDLQFLDKTFQTATIFFTLMYMNEQTQEQSFLELRRVLAPKGRVLVWDVLIPGSKTEGENVAIFPFTFTLPDGRVVKTGYGVRWPGNTHDPAYYKALAEKTGFRVVREKCWSQAFFLELQSTAKFSLADVLQSAAGGGAEAILKTYREIKASALDEHEVEPYAINHVGQRLVDAEKFAEAIAVFQINVLEFPDFWGWYDSLAGAWLKAGNRELAIENYGKALQLDPGNTGVQDSLKKLHGSGM